MLPCAGDVEDMVMEIGDAQAKPVFIFFSLRCQNISVRPRVIVSDLNFFYKTRFSSILALDSFPSHNDHGVRVKSNDLIDSH